MQPSQLTDSQAERLAGKPKAVILLSGGLDSATTLYLAHTAGYECHALSFNYQQRHSAELFRAQELIALIPDSSHLIITLPRLPQADSSALTSMSIDVPSPIKEETKTEETPAIPVTYVPGRNILFLSYAVGYAEHIDAQDIFLGVNAVDYSGYPDCRPEFLSAFESAVNKGMKKAVEGNPYNIHAPLIQMTKGEIISTGLKLGVPYEKTSSCYNPTPAGKPCLNCDSCAIRAKGFKEATSPDPLLI